MNILEAADNIVNKRGEEKERQYGPFSESVNRAAELATLMSRSKKEFTGEDVLIVLSALKLSRNYYGYKEDNLLDCVAYLGALNNYIQDGLKCDEGPGDPIDNTK